MTEAETMRETTSKPSITINDGHFTYAIHMDEVMLMQAAPATRRGAETMLLMRDGTIKYVPGSSERLAPSHFVRVADSYKAVCVNPRHIRSIDMEYNVLHNDETVILLSNGETLRLMGRCRQLAEQR
jgi:hypothetical protein